MSFLLSERSRNKLVGINPSLAAVVEEAIKITSVDFAVIEGLRTEARQRELVAKGASQTMNSKHLTGEAVDLAAFVDGRISWELSLYDEIASAMRRAAMKVDIGIRWGGAWNISDIRYWQASMEAAMNYYIDERRKAGKRPFIDAPHFELA